MDAALLLFAFTAGAVAFFAPCCVGMLPAYVAYAVRPPGDAAPARATRPAPRAALVLGAIPFALGVVPLFARSLGAFGLLPGWSYRLLPPLEASLMLFVLGSGVILNALVRSGRLATATRGLVFGLFATMGILLGFLLVGLPVALLAGVLAPYLPLVSALVGAVILLLGVAALAGRSLAPRLPALAAGDVSRPSGFLKFGLAYAVAGLSCTFPAFLAVMAAGVATGGFATALLTFVAYASGKATILIGVTAIIVAGGEGLAPKLKAHARHAEKVSGALLVLAGLFMLYYFALPLVIAG